MRVQLDRGSFRIEEIAVQDEELATYLAEVPEDDRPDVLRRALKVGLLALKGATAVDNVDYIEKEFNRLRTVFEQQLNATSDQIEKQLEGVFDAQQGLFPKALELYLGEGGRLADFFNENNRLSAISRLRELMEKHFDGDGSMLYKLLDSTKPNSPLYALKKGLEQQIHELSEKFATKQAADEAAAEEREKGTQKGLAFEESVFAELDRLARPYEDVVVPVGREAGITGDKGDVLIELNTRSTGGVEMRIAVEAKDRQMGMRPLLRELDQAKANRDACAVIGVVSRAEYIPGHGGGFRSYGEGRYVCVLDKDTLEALPLEVAYQVARTETLLQLKESDVTIDAVAVREKIQRSLRKLEEISTIKRQLTEASNRIGGTQDALDSFREDLRDTLSEAADLLASSELASEHREEVGRVMQMSIR